MSMNTRYIAIMAGGVGSRFWPSSREALPKQFLDILGTGESLLQATFRRCMKLVDAEHVLIVTNKQYKPLVQKHLPDLPEQNILCEPSRNNTAPCVAYTALRLKAWDEDSVMAILPSDHVVAKEEAFVDAMNRAFDYASDNNTLLTLGIQPTRPDTGYGYIERAETLDEKNQIYQVASFREKPDHETAVSYLDSGEYVWNAGIFIWSVKSILGSFEQNAPGILDILQKDDSHYGSASEQEYIDEVYPKTEKISVDYAIMERAKNVATIPVDIGWSDLGTWASLYDHLPKDDNKNVLLGKVESRDSQNNLIVSKDDKLVVIKGLDNFIVIDEKDVLMIWPKSEEQAIKKLRGELEDRDMTKYL